jgi:hypothetical protein
MKCMSADPNAPSMPEKSATQQELRKATDVAGFTVVAVPPVAFLEEEELKKMCANNYPALLVEGEGETIVNAAAKLRVLPLRKSRFTYKLGTCS